MKHKILLLCILIILIVLICQSYVYNESFEEGDEKADVNDNMRLGEALLPPSSIDQPILSMADDWMTPQKSMRVTRMSNLTDQDNNIIYTGNMTISFWIHIQKFDKWWRNVIHVTKNDRMLEIKNVKKDPLGTTLPYTTEEDFYRRPAIFIIPKKSALHICHDSYRSINNPVDIDIPRKCMVTIVWKTKDNNANIYIYVNGREVRSASYSSLLAQPDVNAILYMCDRFYNQGGFSLKHFKIFLKPLEPNEVFDIFDKTKPADYDEDDVGDTFRIIHPGKNKGWKLAPDMSLILGTDSNKDPEIKMFPLEATYMAQYGFVALLIDKDVRKSIRHGGYVLWSYPLEDHNDSAWYLLQNKQGNFFIYNDFGGGAYVGYDDVKDKILIVNPNDKRIVAWKIDPPPDPMYVKQTEFRSREGKVFVSGN